MTQAELTRMRDNIARYYDILTTIKENPLIDWQELKVAVRMEEGHICEDSVKLLEKVEMLELRDNGTFITPKGEYYILKANQIVAEMVEIRRCIAEYKLGLKPTPKLQEL